MGPAVLNDEVFVISLCTIWNVIGGDLLWPCDYFYQHSFDREAPLFGRKDVALE